jgi:predicted metal-dependent enzyme (double-stranded beta helix superfamily)
MSSTLEHFRHPVLNQFIEEVERSCEMDDSAREQLLHSSLNRAIQNLDWLIPEFRVTNKNTYSKFLVYADQDERFCIVSLVWDFGQKSPVHAHRAWCAYGVAQGSLTESLYLFDPAFKSVCQKSTEVRNEGYTSYASKGVADIHRLENTLPASAISIHVYGLGEKKINTDINQIFS